MDGRQEWAKQYAIGRIINEAEWYGVFTEKWALTQREGWLRDEIRYEATYAFGQVFDPNAADYKTWYGAVEEAVRTYFA